MKLESDGPKTPMIPFTVGESVHRNIAAGQISTLFLSAGRWSFSPRSLVPYARVEVPQYGGRELTWGESIEVPQGSQGIVTNSSAHPGDLVFDGMGTGAGFSVKPPGQISIPTQVQLIAGVLTSSIIDTRRARRAYFCSGGESAEEVDTTGPLSMTIIYLGNKRGTFLVPGGFAFTNGGQLTYGPLVIGYKRMIPLGYGTGEVTDASGNSAPETRPMALYDSLFVQFFGTAPSGDHYFLLEY